MIEYQSMDLIKLSETTPCYKKVRNNPSSYFILELPIHVDSLQDYNIYNCDYCIFIKLYKDFAKPGTRILLFNHMLVI